MARLYVVQEQRQRGVRGQAAGRGGLAHAARECAEVGAINRDRLRAQLVEGLPKSLS